MNEAKERRTKQRERRNLVAEQCNGSLKKEEQSVGVDAVVSLDKTQPDSRRGAVSQDQDVENRVKQFAVLCIELFCQSRRVEPARPKPEAA